MVDTATGETGISHAEYCTRLQDVCRTCSLYVLHVLIMPGFSKDCSDTTVRTSVDCK